MLIEYNIGVETVSEANMRDAHHMVRARRVKFQRTMSAMVTVGKVRGVPSDIPLIITLTRIAPRLLDSDNAVGALKHVRDGIADALGRNDGSKTLDWQYKQERGRSHAVGVRIEHRTDRDLAG